jgi:hypothetical protein
MQKFKNAILVMTTGEAITGFKEYFCLKQDMPGIHQDGE